MVNIRRPAIFFALGSSVYWVIVSAIVGAINSVAGHDVAPYWMVAFTNTLPGLIYVVVTLFFCHWLARRVVRQVQERAD